MPQGLQTSLQGLKRLLCHGAKFSRQHCSAHAHHPTVRTHRGLHCSDSSTTSPPPLRHQRVHFKLPSLSCLKADFNLITPARAVLHVSGLETHSSKAVTSAFSLSSLASLFSPLSLLSVSSSLPITPPYLVPADSALSEDPTAPFVHTSLYHSTVY